MNVSVWTCTIFAQLQFHNKSLSAADTYLGNKAALSRHLRTNENMFRPQQKKPWKPYRRSDRLSYWLGSVRSTCLAALDRMWLHSSWELFVVPTRTRLPADCSVHPPALTQSTLRPSSPQHLHRVTRLTPPHPTRPNSTRCSRSRRTGAARPDTRVRSFGWSGGTAGEADTMRVTGSHMVSADF